MRHLLPPALPPAKPQGSQGRGSWCWDQGGSSEVVRVARFWIDGWSGVCSWTGLDFCPFIAHSAAVDKVHHREAGLLPPSADIILLCAR